jgi:hypothetical protein
MRTVSRSAWIYFLISIRIQANVASSNASIASSMTVSILCDSQTDYFSLGKPGVAGEERFRSQFDLTESARSVCLGFFCRVACINDAMLQSRAAKRTTLTWTDFSSSGFTRTDTPLSATLQFRTPLVKSTSSWPEQQADITRKLQKTQKSLPPFGWDTEPVVGAEVIIEAFMDIFCDLMYGGGWMEIEREEVDRECNWALVSAAVLKMRDHLLTCFMLADRVQVASLD